MARPSRSSRVRARLLSLAHAVHRDDPSSGAATPVPTFLCVYRDESTYDVRTLELTSTAHALIDILQAGNRTLFGAIEESATREGVPVDAAFLEATSVLLALTFPNARNPARFTPLDLSAAGLASGDAGVAARRRSV